MNLNIYLLSDGFNDFDDERGLDHDKRNDADEAHGLHNFLRAHDVLGYLTFTFREAEVNRSCWG